MKKLSLQLLVTVVGFATLNAQSTTPVTVRLSTRSGLVEVQRGDTWVSVAIGELFREGEHVRTATGSFAALEVGPNKVVTLNASTEIQVRQANGAPMVQLESGSMKVFSASDIQVAAKDTVLESTERPVDLELGYQTDKLNLTVFNGAVRIGPVIIHGGAQDPTVRTYTANGQSAQREGYVIANPTYYIYPYFLYGNGNPDPNAGRIIPPVVINPTHPGYRPTQIVPPMSDPIRVPVTRP